MGRITEKQLENWICKHPEALGQAVEIIERQLPLPDGRLDLLAWSPGNEYRASSIMVIELKARPLADKDIGQVLRYVNDVRRYLWHAGEYYCPITLTKPLTIRQEVFRSHWNRGFDLNDHGYPIITPILIATDVDNKILAAASVTDIWVRKWQIDGSGGFRFEDPWVQFPIESHDQPPSWAEHLTRYIYEESIRKTEAVFAEMLANLFRLDE